MTRRHSSGVTLVELIIVVVILAILLAIAIPSFTDYFQKARVRGAADGIVGLLAQARSEAVRRNRQTIVTMAGTASGWCAGASVAPAPANEGDRLPDAVACDCTVAANTCDLAVVRADSTPGVTWTVSPFEVRFNPKLGASAALAPSTAEFQSQNAAYQLRVVTSALGQARVCRLSTSGVIIGYREC